MQTANKPFDNFQSVLQNAKEVIGNVVWINKHADFVGGAERYIIDMVNEFNKCGIVSTLLYEVEGHISASYTQSFQHAFPVVDLKSQLAALSPDLVYIHALHDETIVAEVKKTPYTAIRFFHDHKLFCLREHKYTTLTQSTCVQSVGSNCIACLGFINKGQNGQIEFRSLNTLLNLQEQNKQLDGYIVGSEYMKKELEKHGFPTNKSHKCSLFTHSVKSSISYISFVRARAQFLFVGQLVTGKGLDTLLMAFTALPLYSSLLVCGEGKQKAELITLAKQLNISDRVKFLGKCHKEKLVKYYKESTALCIPSRSPETFSLVGIEALAHGCPVVAANVGGINEWLDNEKNGLFFNSNNEHELIQQLNRLIKSPELVQQLSSQATQSMQDKFTINNHIHALLNSIKSIKSEGK